ncbi:ATP-binding protein [bacterium]|nr:ATP-binding protein [bacterium]
MFFKKIIFSKDSYWVKLRDKKFDFTTNDKEEIATFVIFIGKNSCGKTTLLDFIRQIINKSKSLKSTPINNNGKEHVFFEFLNNNRQVNEIKLVEPVVEKDNNQNLELYMRLDCDNHDFFILSQKNNNLTMDIEEFSFYNLLNTNKNDFMENNFPEIGEYNVRSHYGVPTSYSLSTQNTISSIIDFYLKSNKFTNDSFAAIDMSDGDIEKNVIMLKGKTIFSTLNAEFNKNNGITFRVTNYGKTVYINEKDENVYPYRYLSSGLQKGNSFLISLCKIKKDIKIKKLNNDSNKTNINFFLDEIENSLCPNEQVLITKKIIDDTTEINQGQKICQFFIATHSPFILKNFLSEERNGDTVIINVETGENILKSEKKKLLLNVNNNVSYDEISYLYYGIPTSNYYISLYEAMKMKFKEKLKKEVNYSNEDKERLLPFYLAKLFDYTDWESFVAKFNDES